MSEFNVPKFETNEEFTAKIESEDVVVYVGADWCGPCKMFKPIVNEAYEQDNIPVYYADADKISEVKNHGVRSIPTLLFFKGGKLVESQVGLLQKDVLVEKVNSIL